MLELPNGDIDYHVPNLCLRGTTSDSKARSLDDCFPKQVGSFYPAVVSYSPVNASAADMDALTYDDHPYGLLRSGLLFFLFGMQLIDAMSEIQNQVMFVESWIIQCEYLAKCFGSLHDFFFNILIYSCK